MRFDSFTPKGLLVGALAVTLVAAACGGAGEAEETLEELNEELAGLEVEPFRPAQSSALFLPDPPEDSVTVKLNFPKYLNKLPGEIEVHAPAGRSNRLYATESLAPGEEPPVGDLIPDGIAFVEPGVMAMVTLVYRNPTDQPIRIRTVAPFTDPVAASPLAYGRCWCDARGFDVPPSGSWYRTIGVGVAMGTPAGAKAIVSWPVIVEG